jgi:omega-6 fatty acid desaturase (delta-12 desaturase)
MQSSKLAIAFRISPEHKPVPFLVKDYIPEPMTVAPTAVRSSATLDPSLRLKDILKTLPKSVFQKDSRKAWLAVVANIICVSLGYLSIAYSPWYLLPLAWIFTGTALTGSFVIGHDCGHRSFSNNNRINDVVGHLMFLPLFFPFHGWRIQHDFHHKHTNKLSVDNAWVPFTTAEFLAESPTVQFIYTHVRGRFWWLGSIGHWFTKHFNWNDFQGKQREQVRFSALFVIVGMVVIIPTLIATTGIVGFFKFWALPWLVYHFWMSTFTIVHHTLPEIPFTPADTWNEAAAQLSGTVHCNYPKWVEVLCFDINVHIPHHLSTGIPWYNLRNAHAAIQEHWGDYTIERDFSWALMKEITDVCHIYDDQYRNVHDI